MKNNELLEALNMLEAEKNISKSVLLEAIENSLLIACKNHFGKADNVSVNINPSFVGFGGEEEVISIWMLNIQFAIFCICINFFSRVFIAYLH